MENFKRTSLKKWMGPVAAALALAGLLAALSTAVLGAFDGGAQAPEVIHRTARPATATRTPTISPTPTTTLTPSETPTPTLTPTPFPTKNPAAIGHTVMIGGSTGDGFLSTSGISYVPMFDGGVSESFAGVGHVVLPGAITHLSVHLTSPVGEAQPVTFSMSINGKKSLVACAIPSKGKGDFCESGDKAGDCVEVGPQDMVAVQAVPIGIFGGQPAGSVPVRMSWVAKLDLYGECPAPYVGLNSCQAFASCLIATGHIGNNSCNTPDSCRNISADVGDGSCNGAEFACNDNTGDIGNGSCNGVQACIRSDSVIGNNSCNADGGCRNISADIGDGSCNGGSFACSDNTGDIGDGSCNGVEACISSDSVIGNGSCNGDQSCAGSSSQVGNNSCNGNGACYNNSGDVGNNACNGALACKDNTAPIADNTCNTDNACQGP